MESFCTNCGASLAENAKFCKNCGHAAGPPIPQPQPPAGQPVWQAQSQQQYAAPTAQKKKKSKLKIILPIVGAVLVGIALLLIFVVLPFTMNTMAERDFYSIAANDVPTVKYILGEKRTVAGVSTATRSDGYQEQIITYKSEGGVSAGQDMLAYATGICDSHGFYSINDNNFSGVTGKGFRFAKLSNTEGNLVIVQIDYDMGGYTITLLHGAGTLKIPETSPGSATGGPWVGLWRYEGNDGVALYGFDGDGTFRFQVCYTDGAGDELTTGKYSVSDGGLTLTGVIYNGTEVEDDILYTFEGGGSAATINGLSCTLVPEKDAKAVLADPLAPYPAVNVSGGTVSSAPACSFTGTWQLSDAWGKMFLTQTGDKVTGTYEIKGGVIEGTVSGNTLAGTWHQTSNQSKGTIQLTMSDDGKSFGLKWEYETDLSKVDWPKDAESDRGRLISSGNTAGSLTAGVFDIFDGGTYRMVMRTVDGEASQEIEVCTKGGQTAMLMESEGIVLRIVIKNGKSYTIMDEYKTIMIYAAGDDETPGVDETSNLTFVRQGAEDFHGNTYTYDEYTDDSGSRYFYYMKGGGLKGIRTVTNGDTSDVEILAFDANVPDNVFDIPTDYAVQDMSGG
jgi:hypothetical protein